MDESLSFEEKLKLESWGLPKYIQLMYEKRGIKTMFPWQVECLSIEGVLDGKNLIYSAPTSAGKTLVAEMLCLQSVLEKKKKAIIILPFVSVVREKMFYFQDIVSEAGIRVAGFMGSYHPPGGFKSVHIAVCTIEKANNLINRLMEEDGLSEVGCVVVDELHMLGDPHRGYLLELLLTKLKFITKRGNGVKIQIVGMSATLPNLDVVARWLDAALYRTDFRPVPLKEFLKVDRELYSSTDGFLRDIEPSFEVKNDPGDVIFLCIETILLGYSILVFCPTKNWCESLAQQISAEIRRLGSDSKSDLAQSLRSQLNSEGIADILERLKRCPAGLDPQLGRSVAFGVSFHHAGLTLDERGIVEGGFKEGLLRVLVATTTLSSGVNLPARRVLVRSPLFNSRPLDVLTYKQMIGRAGRMGRDTQGESYLICSDKDKECGRKLISSDLPPVSSCLASSDMSSSLTRAILEVVASGVTKTVKEIEDYASCTLVHICEPESLVVPLATCLSYLETNEFTRSLQDGTLAPSPLAQATLSASLYPHQAVTLLQELHKASTSFILNNHLHAIYQVTPYSVSDQWSVDWVKMFNAWEELSPDMKAVGFLVGVEESFLVQAIRTGINTHNNAKRLSVHRRFYTALALQDLINEVPLSVVVEKFSCNKGMLQSLQQSASTFAGMVTRFCERLGWTGLEAIVEQLSSRIEYGAQKELLDLLRLDCFTAQIARALHSSGIKTIPDLASASCLSVQHALTRLIPFLSEEMKKENKNSKCIWVTGKTGLTEAEAAQYFINRARKFLLEEMGVANASWKSEETTAKEINSIYLNSTVNPYDLSNDMDGSRRKSKVFEVKAPTNRSTPVSSVISRRESVSLSKKNTQQDVKPSDVEDKNVELSLANIGRLTPCLNNFRTSSPLNIDVDKEGLLDNESPILVKHLTGNYLHDVVSGGTLKNVNKSTLNDSITVKNDGVQPSRLSVGDLFESFDGAAFNVTPYLVGERNELVKDEMENKFSTPKDINLDPLPISSSSKHLEHSLLKSNQSKAKTLSDVDLLKDFSKGTKLKPLHNSDSESEIDLLQNKEETDMKISKIEKSKTRNSLDMFFDSFSFNTSSFSQAVVAAVQEQGKVLEEFDCNWGGESILETSLILNNISKNFSPSGLKRKLSVSNEIKQKRRKKSLGNPTPDPLTTSEREESDVATKNILGNPTTKDNNIKPDIINNGLVQNKKTFKKNSHKVSCAVATSTQKYIFDTSKMPEQKVINFDLGTCSEISVIGKNDNQQSKSSSEDSIVESPTQQTNVNKRKNKKSLKLQLSNVIGKSEKPVPVECRNNELKASTSNSNERHYLSGALTDSYLNAAFGETFINLKSPPQFKSVKNSDICGEETNLARKSLACDQILSVSVNLNASNLNNKNPHSPLNPLKRLRSNDLITESQDVFMTPPREFQDRNGHEVEDSIDIKTPTKKKATDNSPMKTFKQRLRRDDSVSPRRSKKETSNDSPSKYEKLNLKIVKTPEKVGGSPPVETITPTKLPSVQNTNENAFEAFNSKSLIKTDETSRTPLKIVRKNDNPSCKMSLQMNEKQLINNKTPIMRVKSESRITTDCVESLVSRTPLKYSISDNCISSSSNLFVESKTLSKAERTSKNTNCRLIGNKTPSKVSGTSDGRTIECETHLSSSNKLSSGNRTPSKVNRISGVETTSLKEVTENHVNCKVSSGQNCIKEVVEENRLTESNTVSTKRNPELILACQSSELLKGFEEFLSSRTEAAVSFDMSKSNEKKSRIGSKIRKRTTCQSDDVQRKFTVGSVSLDGLAFYSGQDVYYIDLLCQCGLCLDVLIYVLNRSDLTLVMFDVRDKLKLLYECCGITVECHVVDPLRADWLLDPQEKSKSLIHLVKEYGPLEEIGLSNDRLCLDEVVQVWHVMSRLESKLSNVGLLRHFLEVEMPLSHILVHMELTGVGFDVAGAREVMKNINDSMKQVEEQAYGLANRHFNVASRNDLAKVRKLLNISADNEKDHPFMITVQNWRKLHSLKTRNLSGLMLDPKERLHPASDTKTATGRVTLYGPDLQHIPRDFSVDSMLFSPRSCFVPHEGNMFVGADYCQLELRILAHYSKDKVLLASFSSAKDVFKDIAAKWNHISVDEVNDEMRHKAKQVCYGLVYGMGHACLGEQLGVSALEAASLQAEFKRRYPGVKSFIEDTITSCRNDGFIKTLSGRTRPLPHINSTNPAFSRQGERQAVNSVIQGSASDIAKLALVKIESNLNELVPERSKVITDECACHLVLHLHDEFIYEVSSKYVDLLLSVMKDCMEQAVGLSLPLPVKLKTGLTWGSLEPVT